jgi:hypothetical protein
VNHLIITKVTGEGVMEECDEMVGAVIEVRVGKRGDDSNLYTLCSHNGIRPCGTQFTGHDAVLC